MTPSMLLLPPDYHKQIARELVEFFHGFYRFGGGDAAATFAPDDPAYQALLHNVLFASLTIGALVFVVLCIVVVRRTILHIRSASAVRVSRESHTTMEISAVILLTVLAISSLSGLLGEAQVDYSAGVVREAMTNTSDQFVLAQHLAHDVSNASSDISFLANGLVVSFNESDLPPPAFELSIRALQLTHVAKELSNATTSLLPHDYAALAHDWQFSYFMLKSTTNAAILAVALASFLSISSIGWSMVSPLRLSIFVILSVVPISHTLIGVYLSSTILTADFCAAPLNSTRTLLHTTPTVDYYLECPANVASPLMAYASSVGETTEFVASLQKELEDYALHHGETGLRMKREFLDPIGEQLAHVDSSLVGFAATQACDFVAGNVTRAMDAYCEFGMVGFFSMWVHQMILCLILFVSVVTTVIVYERVHIREAQHEMRYQLLSTYEDEDVEHVYLSSD